MTAWILFYHPMKLSFDSQLYLLIPVLAAVAIVYKTIRTEAVHRLPRDILVLLAYMMLGLVVLCAGLWLVHEYWR